MEYKYKASPFIRDKNSTDKIMIHLFVGLMIIYIFGIYRAILFGKVYLNNLLLMTLASFVCTFAVEIIWALVHKKPVIKYVFDSYGYITALILVLTCSVDTKPFAVGVASVLATLFGKLVFGGFGQNIFNPAGVGRAIIGTSFAGAKITDALAGATATSTLDSAGWMMNSSDFAAYLSKFGGLKDLLLGINETGAIGESSFVLILLVAIYLTIMKVIDWRVPLIYIGTIFVGTSIIGLTSGLGINYGLTFIATGGIAFGGVFMLTDPVTNPNTRTGKIIFSCIAALLTVLIRLFGSLPEGVVFSILIVNMLTPVIDKFCEGMQTNNMLRRNIVTFGSIILVIILIAICGSGLQAKPNTINNNLDTTIYIEEAGK